MADARPRPEPAPRRARHLPRPSRGGKGTQAGAPGRRTSACPGSRPGDMLRDAIAAGTPLGPAGGPAHGEGRAGARTTSSSASSRSGSRQPDCARGLHPRRLPAHAAPGRGLRAHGAAATATAEVFVFNVEVPRDELLRRLSGRRWCPTCQATYHVYNNPPKNDSLCDQDGTRLIQREDDKETAVARRLAEYDERTAPLIEYYRSALALPQRRRLPPGGRRVRRADAASCEEARVVSVQKSWAELQKMHRACTHRGGDAGGAGRRPRCPASPPRSSTASPASAS